MRPADLKELSDKDLIKRYCPERKDEAAIEELWRRHSETVYEYLEKSSRTLCPAFYDRDELAHASYMEARKNLRNRICGFRELDSARSLKAWLRRVAYSTMRDERRKVTESRTKTKTVSLDGTLERMSQTGSADEDAAEKRQVDPVELTFFRRPVEEALAEAGELEIRTDHAYFRSGYLFHPFEPVAPVEREMATRQRKSVFRDVLAWHAAQSDKDMTCSSMIRLRYWKRWSVAEVVEHVYGPPATETRKRAYYRLLDHNYIQIQALLYKRFGITGPQQA